MKLFSTKTNARRAAKIDLSKGDYTLRPAVGVHFEIVEQDGKFGWRPISAQAADAVVAAAIVEPVVKPRKAKAKTDDVAEAQAARESKIVAMANEMLAAHVIQPEWPTSFVPNTDAGEIASSEYGMLSTRERAVEAAKAAGCTDPHIKQSARGMWIWKTQQLHTVWEENRVADLKRPKLRPALDRPKGKRGATNPKFEIALGLLGRHEGATAAEVAEATGWQEHSARARIVADFQNKMGLAMTKVAELGRGKVYRLAAQGVAV